MQEMVHHFKVCFVHSSSITQVFPSPSAPEAGLLAFRQRKVVPVAGAPGGQTMPCVHRACQRYLITRRVCVFFCTIQTKQKCVVVDPGYNSVVFFIGACVFYYEPLSRCLLL